jgi:hypothetical protein
MVKFHASNVHKLSKSLVLKQLCQFYALKILLQYHSPILLPLELLYPHTQNMSAGSCTIRPNVKSGVLLPDSWNTTMCSNMALLQHVAKRHLEHVR